jgi:hypothetical protein
MEAAVAIDLMLLSRKSPKQTESNPNKLQSGCTQTEYLLLYTTPQQCIATCGRNKSPGCRPVYLILPWCAAECSHVTSRLSSQQRASMSPFLCLLVHVIYMSADSGYL